MKKLNLIKIVIIATISLFAFVSFAQAGPTIVISKKLNPGASRAFTNISMIDGPLRADAKTVNLKIDMNSLSELIEAEKLIRLPESNGFYRERRGFRNLKLMGTVNYDDHATDTITIPLQEGQDINHALSLSGFVTSFSFQINGESDYFKCFNPETCVKDNATTGTLFAFHDKTSQIKLYDEIIDCDDNQLIIERRISDARRQKARIENPEIERFLNIGGSDLEGVGDAADSSDQFAGFASVINQYTAAHIFRDHGGVKVKVDTEPYYTCNYASLGEGFGHSIANKRGQPCPFLSGYRFVSASAGLDSGFSKDYFFKSCRKLD
jgi:hypothetical protein